MPWTKFPYLKKNDPIVLKPAGEVLEHEFLHKYHNTCTLTYTTSDNSYMRTTSFYRNTHWVALSFTSHKNPSKTSSSEYSKLNTAMTLRPKRWWRSLTSQLLTRWYSQPISNRISNLHLILLSVGIFVSMQWLKPRGNILYWCLIYNSVLQNALFHGTRNRFVYTS